MHENQWAIELHELSKTIKRKQLLKPINYQLSSGKILALCGGNGAGKSTLIRLITGFIHPTTGYVKVHGMIRNKHRQRFAEMIGYMPDDFQFHKQMTTKETISFYAKLKNIHPDKVRDTLTQVGLIDQLHEKVGHFSKGMNQRLLLAQVLMADPKVVILDEPTNGLDPYWIEQFCEWMVQIKQEGRTVVFSTHDLQVAEQIADEVMFLRDGEVLSHGAVSQYRVPGLYQTYQELYMNKN